MRRRIKSSSNLWQACHSGNRKRNMYKGKVIAVKGHVVEVAFYSHAPHIHDIVVLEEDVSVKMEIYASASETSFYALALSHLGSIYRGAAVINTGKTIEV